jgi:ABC-2 type transport system permease protein
MVGTLQDSHTVAVSVQGKFESHFKDTLLKSQIPDLTEGEIGEGSGSTGETNLIVNTIEQSPESTRMVVVGSATFIDDFVLELSSRLSQDRFLNNLLFLQNAVDWSVEDVDLLSIRARGTFTRVLEPMEDSQQTMLEVVNYDVFLLEYSKTQRATPGSAEG